MKFAAIIKYISDADKIQSVRPLHRAYLTSLLNQGNIVATGPLQMVLAPLSYMRHLIMKPLKALLKTTRLIKKAFLLPGKSVLGIA